VAPQWCIPAEVLSSRPQQEYTIAAYAVEEVAPLMKYAVDEVAPLMKLNCDQSFQPLSKDVLKQRSPTYSDQSSTLSKDPLKVAKTC
jgi:hypothetical protein